MNPWEAYESRLGVRGSPDGDVRRSLRSRKAQDRILRQITASLAYETVYIDDRMRQVSIADTAETDTKKIFSMPGEDLKHGGIVRWGESYWLITEKDFRQELRTEGKIQRCNLNLKWINSDGKIVERWSIVEDGTKYLAGEQDGQIISVGDARIAITLPRDSETIKISRGTRFLVDDPGSTEVLAYKVTKPNRLFNVYGNEGVYRYVLKETNLTDNDNTELRIADYYSWRPEKKRSVPDTKKESDLDKIVDEAKKDSESAKDDGKDVWI